MLVLLTLFPTIVGAFSSCAPEGDCCETTVPSETSSDDHCLSFCLCSCCGTTVFFDLKKDLELQTKPIQILNTSFIYHSPILISFSVDIFHPPQVA